MRESVSSQGRKAGTWPPVTATVCQPGAGLPGQTPTGGGTQVWWEEGTLEPLRKGNCRPDLGGSGWIPGLPVGPILEFMIRAVPIHWLYLDHCEAMLPVPVHCLRSDRPLAGCRPTSLSLPLPKPAAGPSSGLSHLCAILTGASPIGLRAPSAPFLPFMWALSFPLTPAQGQPLPGDPAPSPTHPRFQFPTPSPPTGFSPQPPSPASSHHSDPQQSL